MLERGSVSILFAVKDEDLSLDLISSSFLHYLKCLKQNTTNQHPNRRPGTVIDTCIPSTGKQRERMETRAHWPEVCPWVGSRDSLRLSQNVRCRQWKKMHDINLCTLYKHAYLYTYVHTCTYTVTNTHTHTHHNSLRTLFETPIMSKVWLSHIYLHFIKTYNICCKLTISLTILVPIKSWPCASFWGFNG